ncbi:glycoside hydrolase family 9 protein [Xanthomonas translucens]|uniref:glycoside hydrolase family 9 protein n=1 Tax=Xanthomonas campestris pv. translucens TaxID=343 RepID=UPI000762B3EE|nr:glycoside hydrolase family 9 protein [Xanthomonas translucens]UKE59522.1 glycoside hydrolase family 9 protein [Xanthomonas translucens pv. hordei]KWV11055.1 cellulase [Xanthomonas translucens]OAX62338.1 cellulase [Xanthomonas translucens pv. translucens]QSQ36342.1 glycoside hydrolase family 9 protein [Xanthomonas translucens pv. translucens]WIH02532.1 glycoside hydrolase family 9 protein [Xanthomonas translucens pv. hordei]
MNLPVALRCLLFACLAVAGCASRSEDAAMSPIRLNQVGYLPAASKLAVVPDGHGEAFAVERADSGKVVLRGTLGPAATWAPAQQTVRIADFSALRAAGHYRLRVDGLPPSDSFAIAADAYDAVARAALKAYYYNRASTALPGEYAGRHARAEGHTDTHVLVHASAASPGRPAGTAISAAKGWYDAGDYNKYVVNSGITVYTLLAAYEQFPAYFAAQKEGIPDSGGGVPDILREVDWNLQWLLAMQDPGDGGVYHKLTNLDFGGMQMPDQARAPRYVVQKSTAATLDFAAVMAQASRIYAPFDDRFGGGVSKRMLQASRRAWAWAQAHPDAVYRQPADVHTGGYADDTLDDEFAWAATELYLATGEDAFYDAAMARNVPASVPSWGSVGGLAWMSLAQHRARLTAHADQARIAHEIDGVAAQLLRAWQNSAWKLAMTPGDFHWGSNGNALNQAMLLLQAYQLEHKPQYLQAAQSQLDYVLGRNPLGMSFVTGIGARSPLHIHHRISIADGVALPVPGLLVGGPQPGQQDAKVCKHAYASSLPALSYLDQECSYASNEVAINWNAPLVYVSAALQNLQR